MARVVFPQPLKGTVFDPPDLWASYRFLLPQDTQLTSLEVTLDKSIWCNMKSR